MNTLYTHALAARHTAALRLRSFMKDESGATAIEYGLFAALIGAAIVGTVYTLGGQTGAGFGSVSDALTDAGITAPAG